MDSCPTTGQLERLLQTTTDGPDPDAVAAHVDRCPHCQRRLERLTADAGRLPWGAIARSLPAATAPPGARTAPAGGPDSRSRLEHEIRALLRRRLRVATL